MTPLQTLVTILCGLVIALALLLLIRSLIRMARGRCCEGCRGCPQADSCSGNRTQGPKEENHNGTK